MSRGENIMTFKIITLRLHPRLENYKIIFLNYSLNTLQENMGYGYIPLHFEKSLNVEPLQKFLGVLS